MKYVSWMYMSSGGEAMKTPLRPPMTNIATKEHACSIGTVNRMLPPHMVPSQLNTLMAEGTEMSIVDTMKVVPRVGFIPLWNMWCPQTIQPRNPIPMIANTMEWYPKIGFRDPLAMMSDTKPIAGRIRMYTSGWPKNQKRCCQSSGCPPSGG